MELAKAYMGSRVSTESPSAISWQNHLVLQPKMPSNLTSITKPSGLESTRSVRFSVSGEIPEGGRSYLTPILHNRSAMYRRDCFPYSKVRYPLSDLLYGMPEIMAGCKFSYSHFFEMTVLAY